MNWHRFKHPSHGEGLPLWERINHDPRYVEARQAIQARYGLPLPFDIRLERQKWSAWLGEHETPASEQAKRGRAFMSEIQALFKKFEVPDKWYADFIAEIAGRPAEDEA